MAHDQTPELILVIHMHEEHRNYDNCLHGSFNAYVYAYHPAAQYEDQPTKHLYAYESPWAQFAMSASYGYMKLAEGRAYGFEAGFQPRYSLVTAQEIDRFHKGLKKIERFQEKYCEAHGRPQSLGQEVVRVMRAIGVKKACWRRQSSHGYGEYRDWRVVSSMEDIRYYIDSTIDACRQKQLDDKAA